MKMQRMALKFSVKALCLGRLGAAFVLLASRLLRSSTKTSRFLAKSFGQPNRRACEARQVVHHTTIRSTPETHTSVNITTFPPLR
jgi:hypothetical protein